MNGDRALHCDDRNCVDSDNDDNDDDDDDDGVGYFNITTNLPILPTYLPTHLLYLTYLPTFLPTYLPTYLTYLPTYLPIYPLTYLRTYLPTYLPTYLSSYQLNRLCRPGSVVGPQQQYLESIETRMYEEGDLYRERHRFSPAVTIGDKSADEVGR